MEKNVFPSSAEPVYFSLNRLKAHCYFPPITVDFSPPFAQGKNSSAYPVFNKDHHHFTPSFLLTSQKTLSDTYLACEQEKFSGKLRSQMRLQECQGSPESGLQLQASESKFCQVCKQRFDDYWTHMANKAHQRKISKNEYNSDIGQLCRLFSSNPPRPHTSTTVCPKVRKAAQMQCSQSLVSSNGQLINPMTHSTMG